MPLHLIHGPPNTGRTGLLESAFVEQIGDEPFLLVPGIDDIFGWEERLTRSTGAMVGGRILHFRDLCREILIEAGSPVAEGASELQRQHFIRKALHREWPDLAGRLTEQPGLAVSVLDLIDEFRGEMIDPETLAERVETGGLTSLRPLVRVYSAYLDLLTTGAGLSDGPRDAELALKGVSGRWGNRPLFIAGFDDMTPQQIELVRRIAVDERATVTVAVAHEQGNPALDWTNELVASLREDARATELSEQQTSRDLPPGSEEPEHEADLLELERRFLEPANDEPIPDSGAVSVLRSSGARNEAEAIAARIARLVEDGTNPGDIAVAVSSPASNGPLIRDVLARYSIPVALEAETTARNTTTGQTILAMLSAVTPGAGHGPMLSWLRSPLGPAADQVDAAEFRARTKGLSSAEQVVETQSLEPPPGWKELRREIAEGGKVNEEVAKLARETGARLLANDESLPPDPMTIVEMQIAAAIASAAEELLEIQDSASNGIADIRSAIETDAIKVWSVPAAGTVRIASPYSLRAKRFLHLFMASQQEGGIRDLDRSGPFLSKSDRDSLAMSTRRDPEVQERYLFYSCLTVPIEGLWISCQTSDEAGKAEQPSPLVASVEELFATREDGTPEIRRGGRAGSDIVFTTGESPSLVEAARSIAASGVEPRIVFGEGEQSARVEASLARARERESGTRALADIGLKSILDEIRRDPSFGATEIEAYAGCRYRWFIERQLRPTDFGPEPDYLSMGSLVHGVLEDLFGMSLQSDPEGRATLGDLYAGSSTEQWLEAVQGLVEVHAAKVGFEGSDPASRGSRVRAAALITRYVEQEAARFRGGRAPEHRVAEIELAFGTGDASEEAVEMEGWRLKGKIDRVDLGPGSGEEGQEAVAIDYKTGSVTGLGHEVGEKKRKIQLQLYMHALRSLGYRPVASLYVPLGQEGGTSRGAYSGASKEEMIRRGASTTDCLDDLGDFIDRGVSLADEAVAGMFAGTIEHDAADCPDHFAHAAVPDPGDEGNVD